MFLRLEQYWYLETFKGLKIAVVIFLTFTSPVFHLCNADRFSFPKKASIQNTLDGNLLTIDMWNN